MAGGSIKGLQPVLLLCTLAVLSLAHLVLADWSSQYQGDRFHKKPLKKYGGYYNGKPFDDDEDDGGYKSNYDDSEEKPYYNQPAYYKSSPLNRPKPIYKPRPVIYKPPKLSNYPQKSPPIYSSPGPIPDRETPQAPKYKPPQEKPPINYEPAPPAYKPTSPPVYPTPETPSSSSSSSSVIAWEKQWLDPHNAARAELGLPAMVWSDKVAQYAEWWANQRKASGCGLQHSGGQLYGENIFWGSGGGYGPAECVAAWVGEKQYYNYADNSCAPGQQCGHYTQIVWASSVNLGCAKVQCDSGQIFMTCNYDPPGNWIGSKPY